MLPFKRNDAMQGGRKQEGSGPISPAAGRVRRFGDLLIDAEPETLSGMRQDQEVRRKWTARFQRKTYMVPNLEFHECADCGEKVYNPQAMRRMEAASPAFARKRLVKRSA